MALARSDFVSFDRVPVFLMEMVFQVAPLWVSAMTDENLRCKRGFLFLRKLPSLSVRLVDIENRLNFIAFAPAYVDPGCPVIRVIPDPSLCFGVAHPNVESTFFVRGS